MTCSNSSPSDKIPESTFSARPNYHHTASQRMFFLLLLLFPTITFASNCGSEVQYCRLVDYRHPIDGYACDTVAGETCLPKDAWCSLGRRYFEGERCNSSQNLMFHSCLSIDFKIDNIDYHLSMVPAEWTVAEQYCQSKGFHLVSFETQEQFEKVTDFMDTVRKNPEDLLQREDIEKVSDPLAQRCWRDAFPRILFFWMGLHYDLYEQKWKYTSGVPVNQDIKSLSASLSDVLQEHNPTEHTRHVSFITERYRFYLHDLKGHREIDSRNHNARILCQKPLEFIPWKDGISPDNSGCITGFKCAGRTGHCVTGPQFTESQICNGQVDCPRGDDETSELCTPFVARFPDGSGRAAHFFPRRTSPAVAQMLCRSRNLTLPSLHSDGDILFLEQLPKLFAKERSLPDFTLSSENWQSLQWRLLLGARGGETVWSDGTKVDFRTDKIADFPAHIDLYLAFSGELGKSRLVSQFTENGDDLFPVCFEHGQLYRPTTTTKSPNGGARRIVFRFTNLIAVSLIAYR